MKTIVMLSPGPPPSKFTLPLLTDGRPPRHSKRFARSFNKHTEAGGKSGHGALTIRAVRLLENTDADGVFDKATVLADSLSWPTGIAC
jgi:hypothetical protein